MRRVAAAGLLLWLLGPGAAARAEEFLIYPVDVGLFRGPAPRERWEFEELRRAGVRTILNLRAYRPLASRREARLAAEHGLAYRHYRYPGVPWALGATEGAYRQLLRTEDYPLYVHCQSSRDRTGLLFGLYRVRRQGWPPEAAYDEMLRFGLRWYLPYFHRYFWENTYGPSQPAPGPGR